MNNLENIPKVSSSGNYAGDGSDNRAIPHNLGKLPSVVIIKKSTDVPHFLVLGNQPTYITAIGVATYLVTAMDATNFYVGNVGSYANSANAGLTDYYWVAIG